MLLLGIMWDREGIVSTPSRDRAGSLRGSYPFAQVGVRNRAGIVPLWDAVARDREGIVGASPRDHVGS